MKVQSADFEIFAVEFSTLYRHFNIKSRFYISGMAQQKEMPLASFKVLVNTTWDGKFESNRFKREQGTKRNMLEIWWPYWIGQIYSF